VIHDNPPALTIMEPPPSADYLTGGIPSLAVDANCSDDYPNCKVKAVVDCFPAMSNKTVLSGTGSIKGVIDTSLCVYRSEPSWYLTIEASDSAGQTTRKSYTLI
jgi:hypothetical protein